MDQSQKYHEEQHTLLKREAIWTEHRRKKHTKKI